MQDAGNRADQLVPLPDRSLQLFTPLGCEPVVLRSTIVLRRALFNGDPTSFDETMERRIERSLLDLQHVLGAAFDGLGDRVAVRRPGSKSPQDQQVEGALQELETFFVCSSRHSRSRIDTDR